jgi:hypothetical protein
MTMSRLAALIAIASCSGAPSPSPTPPIAAPTCRAQVCHGEGDCDAIILQRWAWNGTTCVFLEDSGCRSAGPDCDRLYDSQASCAAATRTCTP